MATKDKHVHQLSSKELRQIAKENLKITKEYEERKKRKDIPESEYITQMKDENNVLEIENLQTHFFTDVGVVKAVDGVTFNIPQGATVGVVGESGCGKSVTSFSVMGLVQAPTGQVVGGEIRFKSEVLKRDEKGNPIPVYELDEEGNPVVESEKVNKATGKVTRVYRQKKDEKTGAPLFEKEYKVYNLAKTPTHELCKIRGREISMIFQEPMTSLNPVFTIGYQLDEVYLLHNPGANKEMAKARTFEMLRLVGIIPENVYAHYPHELSGGMRQRVIIAMALMCNPRLIIGDEPTTALDVTIQAQILDLLRDIKNKINSSIMLITHDLGVIAEMADYVVVMYAGRVIETGTAMEIFCDPRHPYTIGLQKSKPVVNQGQGRLYSIPGQVPNPIEMPHYCYFKDRCERSCEKCKGEYPGFVSISPTHKVACYLYENEQEEPVETPDPQPVTVQATELSLPQDMSQTLSEVEGQLDELKQEIAFLSQQKQAMFGAINRQLKTVFGGLDGEILDGLREKPVETDVEALAEKVAEQAEKPAVELDGKILAEKVAERIQVAQTEPDYELLAEKVAERIDTSVALPDYDVIAENLRRAVPGLDYDRFVACLAKKLKDGGEE